MASVKLSKIIMFCDKCHKRKGPVSSSHNGCGGDEANCTCGEADAAPESQESDSVHLSPYNSSNGEEHKEGAPSTAEKQPTGGYASKRLLAPAQETV